MPRVHGASRRRRLVFLCGVVPVLVTALLGALRPAFLARLDDSVYDILLRSTRTKAPGPGVVIVDVDDRSLSTIGQWPWRRDVVGTLITRLRNAGASAIALDIIFAEPDRYGQPGDGGGRQTGKKTTTPDAALAGALRDGRVILGYGLTFDAATRPRPACVLHPLGLAIVQPPDEMTHEPLFHATGAVCNQGRGVSVRSETEGGDVHILTGACLRDRDGTSSGRLRPIQR